MSSSAVGEASKNSSENSVDIAISFVGINDYRRTKYSFNEHTVETDLFPIFVAKVFNPAYLFVFLTNAAKEKHHSRLENEFNNKSLNINTQLIPVEIPEGKTEVELWEIFEKLVDITSTFSEGISSKRMLIDITHGFRSLPAFAIAACAYLQEVRNIEIVNVLYGAYDARDAISDVTPVFDLTNLANLFRWLTSAHDLTQWGRGDALAEDLLDMFNAVPNPEKHKCASLRGASNALNEYSKSLTLNRTKSFPEKTTTLRTTLNSAQSLLNNIPALKLILEDTVNSLDRDFTVNQSLTESRSAQFKWHIEHDYLYNAVSLARELLVTHAAIQFGFTEEQSENMDNRSLIEGWLNFCTHNRNLVNTEPLALKMYMDKYSRFAEKDQDVCEKCKQPLIRDDRDNESFQTAIKILVLPEKAQNIDSKSLKREIDCWDSITGFRNDLMHSQFGREANNIQIVKLKQLLNKIYNLLSGDHSYV